MWCLIMTVAKTFVKLLKNNKKFKQSCVKKGAKEANFRWIFHMLIEYVNAAYRGHQYLPQYCFNIRGKLNYVGQED